MAFKHLVFDIDGTMMDSEYSILHSLKRMLVEVTGMDPDVEDLRFALGITGDHCLDQLKIPDKDRKKAMDLWVLYLNELSHTVTLFEGIKELLSWLKDHSYHLGIISSQYRFEFEEGFANMGLTDFFDLIILGDDTQKHKPDGEPMECYLKKSGALKEEVLYIGDSIYDMKCENHAGVLGGLALWGCHSKEPIQARYYFKDPEDVKAMLMKDRL